MQEMRAREANMADRHERLPEEQVQSMLFDLFARQQYWSFRELVDKTNQPAVRGDARTARQRLAGVANGWARATRAPLACRTTVQAHLKKILADVAIFHASGPAHNMYELKPEFGGRS